MTTTAHLVFCTNYNGVYVGFEEGVEVTSKMEDVCDDISCTLPSMTYDMVDKFDKSLTDEQVKELTDKATKMFADAGLDVVVEGLEYDHYSS